MRKSIGAAIALSAFALLSSPAAVRAGEMTGCDCSNACPLAQEANQHRATGDEAVLTSKLVRAEYVKVILKNLATL